jgi:iron complex transport system substrate-binding protein
MRFRSPAATVAALLLLALASAPARAGDFTDAAGRHVMLPDHIRRVLPAERNAEVMVLVLAPEKLAGMSRARLVKRPVRAVLSWRPRTLPASMAETAQRLHPDLIIDAGTVTPERAAFADQVMQQTGIPYILIDDSFARLPRTMRSVGEILEADNRRVRDLFLYAEHAIAGLRGRLLIRPADKRPRVYYALGADGLTTALPGSPAGEAIDEAGAINVATPLGRDTEVTISPAQLLAWDPEIIIAERPRFYDALRRNPTWRHLAAVRNRRVYLEPGNPFGWIEDPSGVNRIIGLYWLSSLFYPDATEEDLRTVTCDFYDKFYQIKLTNAQLEAMVRPAGAPPVTASQPVGEPLAGLGAAPPSMSSLGTPAPQAAAPSVTCAVPGGGPMSLTQMPATPIPGTSAPETPATPGHPPPGRRGLPN